MKRPHKFSLVLITFFVVVFGYLVFLPKIVFATLYEGTLYENKDPSGTFPCELHNTVTIPALGTSLSISQPTHNSTYYPTNTVTISGSGTVDYKANNCDTSTIGSVQVDTDIRVSNPSTGKNLITPVGSNIYLVGETGNKSKNFPVSGSVELPSTWATSETQYQYAGIRLKVELDNKLGDVTKFFGEHIYVKSSGGGASPSPSASPPTGSGGVTFGACVQVGGSWVVPTTISWDDAGVSTYYWTISLSGLPLSGANPTSNTYYGPTSLSHNTSYHYGVWLDSTQTQTWVSDTPFTTTDCGGGPSPSPSPSPSPTPGLPDLQVVSITMNKTNYYPGEQLDASIVIRNNGGAVVTTYGGDWFYLFTYLNRASKPPCNSGLSDGDSWGYVTLAPGETKTYYPGATVPMTAGNYTYGVFIDDECIVNETTEANNWRTASYTVSGPPLLPSAPSNLSATPSCTIFNQPRVIFTWNASTGADGYYLDVTTGKWALDGSSPPWSYRQVTPGTANSFIWDSAKQLTPGGASTLTIPANNTQYWWRVVAYNAEGYSPHVYPANDFEPVDEPQISVTTKNCVAPQIDLSASFVPGSWNKQVFGVNETATAIVRVTSTAVSTEMSDPTSLGVWPKGPPTESALPSCPGSPSTPPSSYAVSGLAPGGSVDIPISFNVGTQTGTFIANAYVVPNCSLTPYNDVDWPNNSTADPTNVSFTYAVAVNAWFETTGGDVGSGGEITAGILPPSGRNNSTYLLASVGDQTNVLSEKGWVIRNYKDPTSGAPKRLIPAGTTVYDWLASRFLEKAKLNPQSSGTDDCLVPPSASDKTYYYCAGNGKFQSGGGKLKGTQIWFIDGNLTIDADLQVQGATDYVVFIVRGNIVVNTTVNALDGIYIAGGMNPDGTFIDNGGFRDTTDDTNTSGNQLVIYGAVYGRNVLLNRVISATGGTCAYLSPHSCTNTTDPADVVIFAPKYLVVLASKDLLGSQPVSWREVAP